MPVEHFHPQEPIVPQVDTATRPRHYGFGADTGPHRNGVVPDPRSYRNGYTFEPWSYPGASSPERWPSQDTFTFDAWDAFHPNAMPSNSGLSPNTLPPYNPHNRDGQPMRGRHRKAPPKKAPSKKVRRAAALTAVVLAGGGAAVGLLDSTGPLPMITGANELSSGKVVSLPQPGNAEGTAAAVSAPSAPEPVGQPIQAYMPRHAAGTTRSNAPTHHAKPAPTVTHSKAPSSAPPSTAPPTTSPSPTQPPSPSPTPTPTPTPTPAPTGSGTCTDPTFTTSAEFGQENLGPYTVANNMWNAGGGGITQTLSACSSSSWFVNANVAADGGGVKTYPNSHYNYADPPEISSLSTVTSTFGSSSPGNGDFEDAYDIWLNGTAGAGGDEVMIWTDNHGEYPAGSPVTSATFDGQTYTVWKGNNGPVSFVSNTNVTSGDLNLLQFFQWLISKGWEPANSTLNQVDYGVEINTTNSTNETFSFDNFSVTTS
jgi:hypothetical protein